MTVKVNVHPFIAELRDWRRLNNLSQKQLAALLGCGHASLCGIESLRHNPSPRMRAIIVQATGLQEEVLFPDWQTTLVKCHYFKGVDVELSKEHLIKEAEKMYALQLPSPESMEDLSDREGLRKKMEELVSTLTPREQRILQLRFGLEDGRSRTLEETGKEMKVTRERIRQIEARALRRLRHPTRIRKLKGYLEIGTPPPPTPAEEPLSPDQQRVRLALERESIKPWQCKVVDFSPDMGTHGTCWQRGKEVVSVEPWAEEGKWDVEWSGPDDGYVLLFTGLLPDAMSVAKRFLRFFRGHSSGAAERFGQAIIGDLGWG